MLGIALKGIPRDSYQLMSKVTTRDGVSPQQKFDELRILAKTEYFDIMLLIGNVPRPGQPTPAAGRTRSGCRIEEGRGRATARGPRPAGAATGPGNQWLNAAMIRGHHKVKAMDAEDYDTR